VDTPEPSFEELLADVRAGRPGAAQRLYDLYAGHVMRAVRLRLPGRLRSRFDSLDFCQDVWASIFACPPDPDNFATPEKLAAFLMRVAQNKVNMAVRQHIGTQKHDAASEVPLAEAGALPGRQEPLAPDPTPSAALADRDAWDRLLDRFPPVHRRILVLLREGRTQAEAAAAAGVTTRTVQRVLAQAEQQGATNP